MLARLYVIIESEDIKDYQMIKDFRHSIVIPTSILLSLLALIGGQFLVERVFQFNTTIGVIINFVGGLYFIYILLKEERL